jgi:hypothetical protein
MNNANILNDATDAAMVELIAADTATPAKKAPKGKVKAPKADPFIGNPEAPEAVVKAPKPAPITYAGYELAEGVDPEAVKMAEDAVKADLNAIVSKDADLIGSYLSLGKFLNATSEMFKSPKLYGQYLKKGFPATQELDSALRSNAKWIYEAINFADHEGSDLLNVLEVNQIEDYKSGNPTAIRKAYRLAKGKAALKAEAEANGMTEEEQTEADKAEAQMEKALADADLTEQLEAFMATLEKKSKATICADLADILSEFLTGSRKDALALMDIVPPSK